MSLLSTRLNYDETRISIILQGQKIDAYFGNEQVEMSVIRIQMGCIGIT